MIITTVDTPSFIVRNFLKQSHNAELICQLEIIELYLISLFDVHVKSL